MSCSSFQHKKEGMVSVQSKHGSSNSDIPMLSSGRESQCAVVAASSPTDSGSIQSFQELSIQAASASSCLHSSNDVHSSSDAESAAQSCISSLRENPASNYEDNRSEFKTSVPSEICPNASSSHPYHDVARLTATRRSLSHLSAALVPTNSRVRAIPCSHSARLILNQVRIAAGTYSEHKIRGWEEGEVIGILGGGWYFALERCS